MIVRGEELKVLVKNIIFEDEHDLRFIYVNDHLEKLSEGEFLALKNGQNMGEHYSN